MSLPTHLAQVPDFRHPGGNLRHALLDILVMSVLAVLSGTDDFVEMATFAGHKLPVLATLGRVETLRSPATGEPRLQPVRYYLRSRSALTAAQALDAVRGH